tara:strand:+ start:1226 stop:1708 length:483 start_codon:yes stop_codon:yes gene_type:complete
MNHCLLEVRVKQAPTIRYTQDNKTPLAEMEVIFDSLRAEDQPGLLKVVGWGNMAQELQSSVQVNQKLIIEGRLRMNTVSKQDGSKEKKAELTLSKFHFIPEQTKTETTQLVNNGINSNQEINLPNQNQPTTTSNNQGNQDQNDLSWNSSPLVPDTDEIPF